MPDTPPRLKFDLACAVSKGAREVQEDALIADFSSGAEVGVAVLADGMGGHAAGDLASKIVVTEVFNTLMFRREELAEDEADTCGVLRDAADAANACLNYHVQLHPQTKGMGATLVTCVVSQDEMQWLSIGDSPLYLFRDNVLTQLNEDHSLGPHIDMLVRTGNLTEQEGLNHPERNALTSVLLGRKIPQIDCPAVPFKMRAGDTFIMASDGLQFLPNETIAQILRDHPLARSADLAENLLTKLEGLGDPDLDNITIAMLQVQDQAARPELQRTAPSIAGPGSAVVWWPFRKRRIGKTPQSPEQSPPPRKASGTSD